MHLLIIEIKISIKEFLDLLVRKSKIVYPVLVIAIVAVTVAFALKAGNDKADAFASGDLPESGSSASTGTVLETVEDLISSMASDPSAAPTEEPVVSEEVPLVANEDPAIHSCACHNHCIHRISAACRTLQRTARTSHGRS